MPKLRGSADRLRREPVSTLQTPDFPTKDMADLAAIRHPVNFVISEYDWYRLQEAARDLGTASVSDVIRRACKEWLDDHPHAEDYQAVAEISLKAELERQRIRASRNVEAVRTD